MQDIEDKIDELEERINQLEYKSFQWDIASIAIGIFVGGIILGVVRVLISNLFSF